MFDATVYQQRREVLAGKLGSGLVLLPATPPSPRNYADNVHPHRQSSHVLYYTGLRDPGLFVVLDLDAGRHVLYGRPRTMDDVVWCGEMPSLDELAAAAGLDEARDIEQLAGDLATAATGGAELHYLPVYRAAVAAQLAGLVARDADEVGRGASPALTRAVAEQRLVKEPREIDEIEDALGVTRDAYLAVLAAAAEGLVESDIAGILQGVALRCGREQSFPPITTVRGEVLHNESRHLPLRAGQLLLVDSGAESPEGYASDITRTMPVSGTFSPEQRALYEVVLAGQQAAIEAVRPGKRFKDLHLLCARTMAAGLCELGLLRGDPEEIVAAGAHALLFPHGLGHAMGLDVHDMEDLGDVVGYGRDLARSEQFGLNFLRLARTVAPGHVFTVEPGLYFIPALIDQWAAEGAHAAFIDYDAVQRHRGFGGIRIEDDVLVTADGGRVLGPPIPKAVADIEDAMAR